MEAKRTVREILDRLPDDSTLEDILYHLYLAQAVERGQAEAESGHTTSNAEVRERLHRKYGDLSISSMKREITDALSTLGAEDQRRVLAYARTLVGAIPPGVSGKALLEHVGTLAAADADEMSRAIEEDCERVNPDAW